jgi:hypothetical protein
VALEMIVIPRVVEVIGSLCFFGCQSLKQVSVQPPSSLERIEQSAFERSAVESISIHLANTSNFVHINSGCVIRMDDEPMELIEVRVTE